MARLEAGIFSVPSGHNNGLIFGKARTPDGKKTTVREYVKPTNPRTTLQVEQRTKFQYAVALAKQMTPELNQLGWDRAVNDLPNFQSWVSIAVQNVSEATGKLSIFPGISLGNLHFPDTFSVSNSTDELDLSWSTELGSRGDGSDIAHVVAFTKSPAGDNNIYDVKFDNSKTRTDGSLDMSYTGSSSGDQVVCLWFESLDPELTSRQKFSEALFEDNS